MTDIFDVDNPSPEERVDLAPNGGYPTAAEEAAFIASTLGEQAEETGEGEDDKVLSALDFIEDEEDEPYPQGPAEDIVAESERIWQSYGAAFRKYKDALAAEFESINAYTDARQDAYAEGKLTTVVVAKDGTTTVKFIGGNETERELHERHVLGAIAQVLDEAKQARRLAEVELEFWKEGTRQVETTIRLSDLLLRAR